MTQKEWDVVGDPSSSLSDFKEERRKCSGTKAAIQRKMLRRGTENGAKHLQRIFAVDMSGLSQGQEDIVIGGACFRTEPSGEFTEDHAGTDQTFGVVVVGADPVWEVQKRQEFIPLFEQAFAQAANIGMSRVCLNKPDQLALETSGGFPEVLGRDIPVMKSVVMGPGLLEESA